MGIASFLAGLNRSLSRKTSKGKANQRRRELLRPAVMKALEPLERRQLMAAISTDQIDYAFGQTAHITGTEFAPDEVVQLQVQHVAGTPGSNDDPQNQAFTVQADGMGNIGGTLYHRLPEPSRTAA